MSSLKAFFRNLTSTGDSGDSQEDPLIISDTEVRKPDESLEAPRYDEEEAQHVKTDEIEDSDAIPGSPPNQSHGEEGREEGGDKRPSKRARRDDSQEDLPAAGREHELRAAREAKHAAEDDAHEAKRELRRAERAYRRLEADLRADGNQLQETLRRQTEANASLSMEVEELRALLATRAAELRNAEQYLAKTDTVSHADIARLLQRLNSEILQLCAPLADACRPRSEPRSAPTDEDPVSLREKVARRLGQHAVNALISVRQGQVDFVCVQMALQTLLSRAAAVTISAWDANLVRAWESELHTPPDAVSSDLLLRRLHEIIYQSGACGLSYQVPCRSDGRCRDTGCLRQMESADDTVPQASRGDITTRGHLESSALRNRRRDALGRGPTDGCTRGREDQRSGQGQEHSCSGVATARLRWPDCRL